MPRIGEYGTGELGSGWYQDLGFGKGYNYYNKPIAGAADGNGNYWQDLGFGKGFGWHSAPTPKDQLAPDFGTEPENPFGNYRSTNDSATWTGAGVVAVNDGINPATGLPYTPADAGFSDYTNRAEINGQAEAARQAAENSGGFGDLLPIIALVGLGIATGGFGLFGSGAAAAGSGAGMIGTGMNAGALSLGGQAVGYGTALSGTAGALAGSAGLGLIGDIGTNAAIGAGKSLVTGGDPLEGAVLGGIGGAISGSGVLGDLSGGLIDATGATGAAANAITKGVNAAATGAISAAAGGGSFGDVLEAGAISGLTSGAGNYVAGTVLPETNNTIAGGAGGAAAGLTNAILTGGDIGNAVLTGAGAGAAGGLATDLGAGPGTAGAVGALAGGLIGSAVQQDPVVTGSQAATQPAATTPSSLGFSFSDVLPQFIHNPRADMQWGTRLSGA